MSAKLNRNMYWRHLKKSENITREIATTYKPVNLEDDHFDIEARLELTIAIKGNASEILTITCNYSAHFHAAPGFTLEVVEHFARSGAKIIIWPYFRHFVSDMTSRMHIPPITIPLTLD
jgi:preprotein translocase subunit SecB